MMLPLPIYLQDAVLSQGEGEPRDAAVNFDTYRILTHVRILTAIFTRSVYYYVPLGHVGGK